MEKLAREGARKKNGKKLFVNVMTTGTNGFIIQLRLLLQLRQQTVFYIDDKGSTSQNYVQCILMTK